MYAINLDIKIKMKKITDLVSNLLRYNSDILDFELLL